MENKKPVITGQTPRAAAPQRPVATAGARPAAASINHAAAGARPATAASSKTAMAAKVPQPTVSASAAGTSKKKSNKNLPLIIGICGAIVALVVVIILAIAFGNRGKGEGSESGAGSGGPTNNTSQTTLATEEDGKVTKETLDKYTEVAIDGYQKVDDNEISSDVVLVHVKNTSDEVQSLAIIISAEDRDGNLLDTSALYAERIQPGETQNFQAFVYTVMTPDQMKNATYKVYKASTYEAPTPEASEGTEVIETVEATEETSEETPAETNE